MPHLSKDSVSLKTKSKIDNYLTAFLKDVNLKARKDIFIELLTKTERLMVGKRILLLLLISRGVSTYHASKILKMSPSTVARFEISVSRGEYANIRKWLNKKSTGNVLLRTLGELLMLPFEARRKSLYRMMREDLEK